jgi:hypothetical protein
VPWETLDFRIFRASQPFIAATRSVATVIFDPVPGNQLWRVEQIQVAVVTPTPIFWPGATASVFDKTPNVLYPNALAPFADTGFQQFLPVCDIVPVDTTLSGNGDVAEYSPPVTVLQGDALTVVFMSPFELPVSGVPVVGSVRAQVTILGGVAGQPQPVAGAGPKPMIPVTL